MRNRTEQVTTKIEGSDYDEEGSDFDDSGDDWKPVEGEAPPKGKGKSPGSAKKRGASSKPRGSATKKKKEESSEEEEEDEDDELGEEEESENEDDSEDDDEGKKGKSKRKNSSKASLDDSESNSSMTQGTARKSTTASRAIPDKLGVMTLYLHRGDAGDSGVRNNEKLFIWRRDGSSLLQKYTRDPDSKDELILNPTMVYSCWEDKRKDEYIEVRVQVFGDKKVGKVKVINLDEVEAALNNKSLSGNGQSVPSSTITSGAVDPGNGNGMALGGQDDEDEEEDEEEE